MCNRGILDLNGIPKILTASVSSAAAVVGYVAVAGSLGWRKSPYSATNSVRKIDIPKPARLQSLNQRTT